MKQEQIQIIAAEIAATLTAGMLPPISPEAPRQDQINTAVDIWEEMTLKVINRIKTMPSE